MPGKKKAQKKVETDSDDELDYKTQIKKLKKKIDELEKNKEKPPRKLSALNKFKKNVLGKLTEQALVEADFHDLIAIDKIRLLNRTYPIIWDNLVLEPVYRNHNCSTPEEQNAIKKSKGIQTEYNQIVDDIINKMHSSEKDDQQHYIEDIKDMFIEAIKVASKTFDGADDDDDDIDTEE